MEWVIIQAGHITIQKENFARIHLPWFGVFKPIVISLEGNTIINVNMNR